MQSELKPCPFCGCADIRINIHRSTVAPHYGATAYSIGCYQCGGSVPSRYDRSLLISFWNTRASDAEITRLTEALRAAEERVKALVRLVERAQVNTPDQYVNWHEHARQALAGAKP